MEFSLDKKLGNLENRLESLSNLTPDEKLKKKKVTFNL